jgi:hypothetical protein
MSARSKCSCKRFGFRGGSSGWTGWLLLAQDTKTQARDFDHWISPGNRHPYLPGSYLTAWNQIRKRAGGLCASGRNRKGCQRIGVIDNEILLHVSFFARCGILSVRSLHRPLAGAGSGMTAQFIIQPPIAIAAEIVKFASKLPNKMACPPIREPSEMPRKRPLLFQASTVAR